MPLFQKVHEPDVSPEEAIIVVHRFVMKCQEWASQREIPERVQRVAAQPDPGEVAKLQAWRSYLQFTEHTLRELEDGTLDHWFTGP